MWNKDRLLNAVMLVLAWAVAFSIGLRGYQVAKTMGWL